MSVADAMLARLPLAWQQGPVFRGFVGELGAELGFAELGLLRLLRSRHLALAAGWTEVERLEAEERARALGQDPDAAALSVAGASELGRLAALLNLAPDPGETARDFRLRVRNFLAIHREGLGSARAVLQLAAAELRAPRLPEPLPAGENLERMIVPITDARGARSSIRLELEDFPEHRQSLEVELGVGVVQRFTVSSVRPVVPELKICPLDGEIESPWASLGEGAFLYLGTLPRGSTLHLRDQQTPLLDGRPAPAPVLTLLGGGLDRSSYGATQFATGTLGVRIPPIPDGEPTVRVESAPKALIEALVGDLDPEAWRLDSERFDDPAARFSLSAAQGPGARYAGGATALAAEPTGHAARTVSVRLSWVAREPACFALHFPVNPLPIRFRDDLDLARALGRAVEYGRAAGVRARLIATPLLDAERLEIEDRLTITLGYRLQESVVVEEQLSASVDLTLVEDAAPVERAAITHRHDEGLFGGSLFAEPSREGVFGQSVFGSARVFAGGVGRFGRAFWGGNNFARQPDGRFGTALLGSACFEAREEPRLGVLCLDNSSFPPLGEARFGAARLDLAPLAASPQARLDRTSLDKAALAT